MNAQRKRSGEHIADALLCLAMLMLIAGTAAYSWRIGLILAGVLAAVAGTVLAMGTPGKDDPHDDRSWHPRRPVQTAGCFDDPLPQPQLGGDPPPAPAADERLYRPIAPGERQTTSDMGAWR